MTLCRKEKGKQELCSSQRQSMLPELHEEFKSVVLKKRAVQQQYSSNWQGEHDSVLITVLSLHSRPVRSKHSQGVGVWVMNRPCHLIFIWVQFPLVLMTVIMSPWTLAEDCLKKLALRLTIGNKLQDFAAKEWIHGWVKRQLKYVMCKSSKLIGFSSGLYQTFWSWAQGSYSSYSLI